MPFMVTQTPAEMRPHMNPVTITAVAAAIGFAGCTVGFLSAQNELAHTRADTDRAAVQSFRALGGGWS